MRLTSPDELKSKYRRDLLCIWERRLVNFAIFLLTVFFCMVITRSLVLDTADDFDGRKKTPDEITADYDIPFAVTKPPPGEGWLLTRANLRWLVREEIRLRAIKRELNFENDRAVRAYIVMLNEFNAVAEGCSCELFDFRAAAADIEPYRGNIEEAARLEVEANGWDRWQ